MFPRRLFRTVGDAIYLEALVVENDFPGVGLAVDVERGGSADALRIEVYVEVERDVIDASFQWASIAGVILCLGRVEDGRDLRFRRVFADVRRCVGLR